MFFIRKHKLTISNLLFLLICFLFLAVCIYGILVHQIKFIIGSFFWMFFVTLLYVSQKNCHLNTIPIDTISKKGNILILITILITVVACTAPMGVSPAYNGTHAEHRNQYELMAEALKDGHLYIDYDQAEIDILETLDNPYDPQERLEKNAEFHWDHAYYNRHFYMYFGVVPVLLLFLPFLFITGTSLTTYHATQIFTAGIIIGIFVLFRLIANKHFKKLSLGMYLYLSASFSCISVWYAAAVPALYCTAITSAVCLQIWSIYFFCKAVWITNGVNKQLLYATVGALLGALTFGCRPTIGLANLIVLPLLSEFLRQHHLTPKLAGKLCLAAMPYAIVAIALMAYNYARFENPFEFGQSYQLTVTDQLELFRSVPLSRIINETIRNFVHYADVYSDFPHLSHSSLFWNFPIFFCIFLGFLPPVSASIQKKKLLSFIITIILSIVIITILDVIGSPELLERYRSDIYFIAGLLCFLMIGLRYDSMEISHQPVFSSRMMFLSVVTLFTVFIHYLIELNNSMDYLVDRLEGCIYFWQFF